MLLRARIVLPIVGPPITDGAVAVEGSVIERVGPWSSFSAAERRGVVDLGESVLLPGLVNAHCHLDYTDMAGLISPPRSFTSWIKTMVAIKNSWTTEEFAQSWRRGAGMLLASGCTTVGNIEAMSELLPAAWRATPLRVISFRELISVRSRLAVPELMERTERECLQLDPSGTRTGLSPHAPYTTTRQLLELAAKAADRHHWRLATHVAESDEEFEMYLYRHGAMHDWLKGQREMTDCGVGSPVHYLDRCGYLERNLLAVHVNYLWRDDAALLGRTGVSVAHCPRSHRYFRHLAFPYQALVNAGVNVCLGTDSLATNLKEPGGSLRLDLFAEMAAFSDQAPAVPPEQVLRMVTVQGAIGLGREGFVGQLTPGARADLIAVPFAGPLKDASTAMVRHVGDVLDVMIDGKWARRAGADYISCA